MAIVMQQLCPGKQQCRNMMHPGLLLSGAKPLSGDFHHWQMLMAARPMLPDQRSIIWLLRSHCSCSDSMKMSIYMKAVATGPEN